MMRALLHSLCVASCLVVLVGCSGPAGEPTDATNGTAASGQPASTGVAPIGGGAAAGGLSPVQNSDSVTGAGGGGTAQAAKGMAQKAAGEAQGGTSANETAPAEESGE